MNFIDYLFEHSKNSENVLVFFKDASFTYKNIWNGIIGVSEWLKKKNGSNNKIGIVADNSPFFIQSYAGIIHSGNTAVVIDTKSFPNDIAQIIFRCSIKTVFADEKFGSLVSGVEVISSLPEPVSDSYILVSSSLPLDECAVIIFTSGSMGVKKGVMLTHTNLISNTNSIIQYLNLSLNDRMMVVLPFFYCYGASLLHTHIRVGGSLVLDKSPFLGGALKGINKYHCTGFAGVPSTYLILTSKTPFLEMEFPTLCYFTQAGGHLAGSVVHQIARTFPDKRFFVMYGATEATARLSYLPPELIFEKPDSIGKGIPGVTLEVRDEDGKRVRSGEVGEIIASGENIMKGYLDEPEETRKVIRDGWYYTGDLATVDDDGFIYIVGRKGTFIKSAGFRVSPQEVEDVILQLEGVDACVVFGVPHPMLGEAIIACIMSDIEEEVITSSVKKHCFRYLPSHKQPTGMFILKNLPLNSSGKPDRDAIKKLYTFHDR
ncbi:AMP-binding protein [Methanospirillum sp. J.3.6.1-F.2.7.3]|uniref:AMP-binding protein n=1 Tax=Methanospirillum purgamenti TaxID=2834276 RepID=A0A8E7EK49_9EURY|nr:MULTISPECIES: AMP-binding protein [Methanospirillum]MDX8551854.1 AMP-binding protein [Methanospirillum hungatei]QVV89130.1 AMP-binding protein [Methanospirillum sp. J.3.6.1-F.2.7.3]